MSHLLEEKRSELVRLMNRGFEFAITEKVKVKQDGLFGIFKPKLITEVQHSFLIKEATLATLDLISLESLELDETGFDFTADSDRLRYSRKHYRRMAKIIAIAVCGANAEKSEISEKTDLFFKYLKPSDLYNILKLIDITSNLGDFINSTRLVTAANVLNEADLVEKNESQD
jgi:hypothetical protein